MSELVALSFSLSTYTMGSNDFLAKKTNCPKQKSQFCVASDTMYQ